MSRKSPTTKCTNNGSIPTFLTFEERRSGHRLPTRNELLKQGSVWSLKRHAETRVYHHIEMVQEKGKRQVYLSRSANVSRLPISAGAFNPTYPCSGRGVCNPSCLL